MSSPFHVPSVPCRGSSTSSASEVHWEGKLVNKSELIDALAARYEGNRKQAAHALESVLDTITREVAKGEKVAITGFGSFEKAVRNARWVRNPQTGERMKSKKKSVPKFSAGKELKDVISGAKKLPRLTAATMPKPPGVRAAAASIAPRMPMDKSWCVVGDLAAATTVWVRSSYMCRSNERTTHSWRATVTN